MSRKIIVFCIVILLIFGSSFTTFAEVFEENKTGSISVTLADKTTNEQVAGAKLSVYYVATVLIDANKNLIYNYTEDFKDCDIELHDQSLAEKLDIFVSEEKISSKKITTNAFGFASCDNLPLGLYFIKQTEAVEGFSLCNSFLVTIPNKINNEYVYKVNASPKTEIEKLTTVTIKKVWNTDKSSPATDSVTIQLLNNKKVVKTAVLNAENNWQITYTNMPKSDLYEVKEINIAKNFEVTYKNDGNLFIVTNSSKLIQTGQVIWPIPFFALCGMFLIVAGIALLKKKGES